MLRKIIRQLKSLAGGKNIITFAWVYCKHLEYVRTSESAYMCWLVDVVFVSVIEIALFAISVVCSLGFAWSLSLALEWCLVLLGIKSTNISRRLCCVGLGMSLLATETIFRIFLLTFAGSTLRLLVGFIISTAIKLDIEIFSGEIFSSLSL
jgi:hypothetical protein